MMAVRALGVAVASCLLLCCQVPRASARDPTFEELVDHAAKKDKHEALRYAVDVDDPGMLRKLVKHLKVDGMTQEEMFSTDKNIFNINGYSILHYAAFGAKDLTTPKTDKPEHVKILVESGKRKEILGLTSGQGKVTALHVASQHNNTEVVRTLLKLGADPRIRSESEMTGPTMAARMGHVAVTRAYIDVGGKAKNSLKELDGTSRPPYNRAWAPIQYAVNMGHTALIQCLTFEADWGKILPDDVLVVARMQVKDKKLPQEFLTQLTALADRNSETFKEQQALHMRMLEGDTTVRQGLVGDEKKGEL